MLGYSQIQVAVVFMMIVIAILIMPAETIALGDNYRHMFLVMYTITVTDTLT